MSMLVPIRFAILALVLGWGGASGCTTFEPDDDVLDAHDATFGGKSDGVGEGSSDACAALRVANEASLDELDVDVGLDVRAAQGIVDRRPFSTLAELDAVPYVGPAVLTRLVEFASAQGISCDAAPVGLALNGRISAPVEIHDEWRAGQPLAYTFFGRPGGDFTISANGPGTKNDPVVTIVGPLADPLTMPTSAASLPVVATFGPDPSVTRLFGTFQVPATGVYLVLLEEAQQRKGFVDFRLDFPGWMWASAGCTEPGHCDCSSDAECGIGATCRILNLDPPPVGELPGKCTPVLPGTFEHGDCQEPGGVYRTVTFSAEQACAALDVLNHAPWSVLSEHVPGWAYTAFYQGPGERDWTRVSRWRSLAQFARQTVEFGNVGSFTLKKLKARALTWQDSGEPVGDTVASTWANRFELDGGEVAIDDAVITELPPAQVIDPATPEWVRWCTVVRDDVGAPNFLRVCFEAVCESTVCEHPNTDLLGERVFVTGSLGFSQATGWMIGGNPRRLND